MRNLIAMLALGLLVGCGGGTPAQRNLLVVTIDTLRRDAVGFEGGPATPTLDALSREAFVCDDAYTVAPITLPAHASLMTGLYPASHGVRDNGPMRVPSGVTTLAERLRARGWRTLASVAAVVLDPCFGIDQGFERYGSPPRSFGGVNVNVAQLRADEAVDALLAELDAVGTEEPWFAWLHLYDPHAPYDAPGASRALAKPAAYAAEVQYTDRELGRLFAQLKRRGVWDDLVVVVASDHGEGLADGPEPTHGYFVHDPTMRIPLLIRDPRVAPSRWPHPVSLVDVAPTVLELLAVPVGPSEVDGVSLARFMGETSARPAERTLLIESYLPWISHGWAPFEGGVDSERKVIRSRAREAYDRLVDPGEERNLVGGDDPRLALMFTDVDARMASLLGRFRGEEAEGGSETASLLQALGYAGADEMVAATGRPDFDALADTYAKRPLIDRMDKLGEALARGETEQAVVELRALVALDPENAVFLERLGETLLYANAAANVDEAERVLNQALALRPGRVHVHLGLATCAIARNDEPRIERELRTVLALEPDQPTALYNLSYLLSQRGRAAGDRAAFAEALELTDRLLAGMSAADARRADIEQTRAYLARQARPQ